MSRNERKRMKIMAAVKEQELNQVQAAKLLALSYRQAKRVWQRYQQEGDAGLVHRLRGRPGLHCNTTMDLNRAPTSAALIRRRERDEFARGNFERKASGMHHGLTGGEKSLARGGA